MKHQKKLTARTKVKTRKNNAMVKNAILALFLIGFYFASSFLQIK